VTETELDTRTVEQWRLEQLLSLGMDKGEAALLATQGVSHHDAEDLVRVGCPIERVYWILKP
jgi:hypothetical protein